MTTLLEQAISTSSNSTSTSSNDDHHSNTSDRGRRCALPYTQCRLRLTAPCPARICRPNSSPAQVIRREESVRIHSAPLVSEVHTHHQHRTTTTTTYRNAQRVVEKVSAPIVQVQSRIVQEPIVQQKVEQIVVQEPIVQQKVEQIVQQQPIVQQKVVEQIVEQQPIVQQKVERIVQEHVQPIVQQQHIEEPVIVVQQKYEKIVQEPIVQQHVEQTHVVQKPVQIVEQKTIHHHHHHQQKIVQVHKPVVSLRITACPEGHYLSADGTHCKHIDCDRGLQFSDVELRCVDVNECDQSTACLRDEQCINTYGSYVCRKICTQAGYRLVRVRVTILHFKMNIFCSFVQVERIEECMRRH